MSTIAVNEITDEVGTGSPAFTNGLAQSDIAGALNATGTAPIYACRAWVNFDGTTTPPTIRASGNVLSVTRAATGTFAINFTTEMPDTNYAVVGIAESGSFGNVVYGGGLLTTSSTGNFKIRDNASPHDDHNPPVGFFAIFR